MLVVYFVFSFIAQIMHICKLDCVEAVGATVNEQYLKLEHNLGQLSLKINEQLVEPVSSFIAQVLPFFVYKVAKISKIRAY